MSNKLFSMHCNEFLTDQIIEAKQEELMKSSEEYGIEFSELVKVVQDEINKANTKLGTANMAIDFFIIETLNDGEIYPTVSKAIKEGILSASTYFVNIADKPEFV